MIPTLVTKFCSEGGLITEEKFSVLLDQALTGHIGRLLDAHDLEDGRSNVAELAILNLCLLVLGDIDTWNRVE